MLWRFEPNDLDREAATAMMFGVGQSVESLPAVCHLDASRFVIRETPMLDRPEKTRELMATLEAAVPFEVALTPDLIEYLARQQKPVAVKSTETVSGVFYLGDMGGISCRIQPAESEAAVIVSLTHVRVPRTLPFATAVLDYQKHRVKKLRKQGAK